MAKKSNPNLVQNLYRALNACADHHTEDEIAQVHIETAVESFIKDRARDRVVLVTGNPGDGKTHLLRQLADVLDKKVEVCLDANEMDDGELAAKIDGAFRRKRGGLVVANHSGTIAMDSLMTQVAVHDEHPAHRHLRMLGADLVFQTPVIGNVARKSGSTLAANPDAERLLASGELCGVWPEGFKGVGKPFRERYKLQRFGRGGFVSAALRTGVPIIPCSIVGAEEIYPILGNVKTVARLLGAPYAPITPTWPLLGPLGLVPLPSKWIIEFGAPVATADLGPNAADDPMLVFDLTDQVRETIQQTLYSLLMQRRSVFF